MTDTFNIIGTNHNDTMTKISGMTFCPFGVAVDNNFGKTTCGFYAQYQTTLSSKTFTYSTVDSIVLIVPYLSTYGSVDKEINLSVYEMTENIDATTANTKLSYSYSPTALGSISNFKPNITDSVYDGSVKIGPALRVKLDMNLASRIIAPVSYNDDDAFKAIFKGLYVTSTSSTESNGFVFLDLSTNNRIVIYGKNATNESLQSTFVTGGTNSLNVNDYKKDATSAATNAVLNSNPAGDSKLYMSGLYGQVARLEIPNLKEFIKDKNIFKAELILSNIDKGFKLSPTLGILSYNTTSLVESVTDDELYAKNFRIPNYDTIISGNSVTQYKFNMAAYFNEIISKSGSSNYYLNLYSSPFSIGSSITKNTTVLPSRVVLGGTGDTKPKLRLYYTSK